MIRATASRYLLPLALVALVHTARAEFPTSYTWYGYQVGARAHSAEGATEDYQEWGPRSPKFPKPIFTYQTSLTH
jgi:hypothetical protein